jgi:Domain of unknown function (DUF4190)
MSAGTFNQPTAGYQQQPGYGAQPAAGTSGLAVAGLVLGIIAMLTFWIWGAILFSPLAITFGVLGRKEAREGPKSGEGMGTAGLILGIVALVLTVPWGIIVAMS